MTFNPENVYTLLAQSSITITGLLFIVFTFEAQKPNKIKSNHQTPFTGLFGILLWPFFISTLVLIAGFSNSFTYVAAGGYLFFSLISYLYLQGKSLLKLACWLLLPNGIMLSLLYVAIFDNSQQILAVMLFSQLYYGILSTWILLRKL